MSNESDMIIHSIVGLIENFYVKMSQYFPKLYKLFGGDIDVKVDLSNYATKGDFKKCNRNWYI